MERFEQVPFSSAEFADNPEPRCACVLLLDTSGSMSGSPIAQLNAGLRQFKDELSSDALAAKRVEIAVISFGPVTVVSDFETPDVFSPPTLSASGDTPMGSAIEKALDLVESRKNLYRGNGISYYRPWLFLITDGSPTDSWSSAARRIKDDEALKRLKFLAVGVEGADMDTLRKISVSEPLHLKKLDFKEMFSWLSNSLRSVSQSSPGETVPLVNPCAPNGWASY